MAKFADDTIAFPHLPGILSTLQDVLAEARVPEVCVTITSPGEAIALDYENDECDSLAWARISSVFPASNFPEPDFRPSRVLQMASVVELGIIRRAPVPDNGEAPHPDEQYDAARLQMADMNAMLVALCRYAGDDMPILIGAYTPLGPDGGIVGGVWTATVGGI